jgi:hypothetical protein
MHKALGEQTYVEAMLARVHVGRFFVRREQIKKQRGQFAIVQRARDKLIARTVPAAPAAMGEEDESNGAIGNC